MNERILCFKREILEQLGVFQGLSLDVDKYLPTITNPAQLLYLDRPAAEQDKNYKQIIPYMLLVCGQRILRYRRGKAGGETRLHGLRSVGIGGHIAQEDDGHISYACAMRRELKEETGLDYVMGASAVALLNDDSTEVGSVHFGIVHVLRVASEKVAEQCADIAAPEFIPITEARAIKDSAEYELWSRFCLENLPSLLCPTAPICPPIQTLIPHAS